MYTFNRNCNFATKPVFKHDQDSRGDNGVSQDGGRNKQYLTQKARWCDPIESDVKSEKYKPMATRAISIQAANVHYFTKPEKILAYIKDLYGTNVMQAKKAARKLILIRNESSASKNYIQGIWDRNPEKYGALAGAFGIIDNQGHVFDSGLIIGTTKEQTIYKLITEAHKNLTF